VFPCFFGVSEFLIEALHQSQLTNVFALPLCLPYAARVNSLRAPICTFTNINYGIFKLTNCVLVYSPLLIFPGRFSRWPLVSIALQPFARPFSLPSERPFLFAHATHFLLSFQAFFARELPLALLSLSYVFC